MRWVVGSSWATAPLAQENVACTLYIRKIVLSYCVYLTTGFFFGPTGSPDGLFERMKQLEAETVLLAGPLYHLAGV